MDHYGIKPNEPECGLKLAFRLAQDHVPGMQVVENAPRRKGRPRKPYDVSGPEEINRIIDEIQQQRRKGVMDAIRIAIARKQLQGSADSWETRYYENQKLLRRAEELKRRLPTGFGPLGDPNLK